MALDTMLLEKAEKSAPVLRLYGFKPACMTIGLSQKLSDESRENILKRGFDIVRRPSGGRAVLHYKDLTYSFVGAETGVGDFGFLERGVSAAYKQICCGLQQAFSILGVNAELGSAEAAYRHLADCFLATTNADLHHKGKKLAGSAQLRRRGAVLQHGSIPLNLEQGLVAELLGGQENKNGNLERHANLFELLGKTLSFEELNQAMKAGFESAYDVELDTIELSREEIQVANELKEKYLVTSTW
ncbi:MAG: hypothetical protein K2X81_06620 [Candidatus Obscuribacterales bacterium]|nr:hypothetical protein [Candidatus Obscuribacterales bacterium]